jgi:hypothetical protein
MPRRGQEMSFTLMTEAAYQFLGQHKELAAALDEFMGRMPSGQEGQQVLPFTRVFDHLRHVGRLAHASSGPGPFVEVAVLSNVSGLAAAHVLPGQCSRGAPIALHGRLGS